MPGRSTISTMSAPRRILALPSSTVTPGQLPTLALEPVSRLKKVDLPVFGMPSRAMRFIPGSGRDLDVPGVAATNDDVGGADPYLQWAREEALADHLDVVSGFQTQGYQPAAKIRLDMDGGDLAAITARHKTQGSGHVR